MRKILLLVATMCLLTLAFANQALACGGCGWITTYSAGR